MGTTLLLSPPIVFFTVLLIVLGLSKILSKLSFRSVKMSNGQTKPYACGENIASHMIQPDYTPFFPFAFYFTILDVVALTVALVPIETLETLVMAVIYVFGAIIGLTVLYRR
jgi:NADH:ubiquinone oxidoreductase subunit 3 (subunit A)